MSPGDLGTALREARLEAGLSQRDIASAMSVDATHISHIENGRRSPSLKLLHSWAKACGRTLIVRLEKP